jgi:hypothetical protein
MIWSPQQRANQIEIARPRLFPECLRHLSLIVSITADILFWRAPVSYRSSLSVLNCCEIVAKSAPDYITKLIPQGHSSRSNDDGRGRRFAHIAPRSMALYAGKNLNPRAMALSGGVQHGRHHIDCNDAISARHRKSFSAVCLPAMSPDGEPPDGKERKPVAPAASERSAKAAMKVFIFVLRCLNGKPSVRRSSLTR